MITMIIMMILISMGMLSRGKIMINMDIVAMIRIIMMIQGSQIQHFNVLKCALVHNECTLLSLIAKSFVWFF